MTVQIIINGENAAESLKELSALAGGLNPAAPAVEKKAEPEKQKRQTRKADPEEVKEEQPEAPVKETEPVEDDLPFDEAPVPTDVDLRALASSKAKTAGKEVVKALLDKFEVPNVTGVPANKRIAFMKELEELA